MRQVCSALVLLLASLPIVMADSLTADALVSKLQEGGYVIYVRHAATDNRQKDANRKNLEICETQRNLSQLGKKQAMVIGSGFKSKKIPIGKIISSPWCRARHTAQLAFGRAKINADLGFSITMSIEDLKHRSDALNNLLAETPAAGTNTVLISHSSNLKEASGIWPRPEGAVLIFRPEISNGKGYVYVGLIKPEYWLAIHEK